VARLILHIGLEKTGTKALQTFLAKNRTALRLMGVRYPRCETADGQKLPYHRDLGEALLANSAGGETQAVIDAYAEKAAAASLTILSSELLSAPRADIPARLAPLAARFDVTVIVYLRRQDEWALSAYREAVLNPATAEARPINDWLSDPDTRARLDYDWILRHWEQAFGADALRVRLYPHHLPLIPDFIATAGLPGPVAMLPEGGRRVNETPSEDDVMEALRGNGGVAEAPSLSQPARDRLLASVEAGNGRLRAQYFPEKKTLFGVS